MTTEADLIAAIEAAPDDPAAFLVYADYLQSQNDPRGELITLMHAGAADDFLKSHAKQFIGPFAKHTSIKLEAWRLGFVDHVRLIADDEKHAILLLDQIADHPSLRFLRTLEVLILGKRRSYAGVDAHLVQLARPRTLRALVLGKSSDHALSKQLLETFPNLAGPARKSRDEVIAAIRASRGGTPPGFAPDALAPLVTHDRVPLPCTAEDLVRGLAGEVGRKQPYGLVTMLQDECTPASLDAFCASLVTAWMLHGEEPRTAWVYDAAALLGGAQSAYTIMRHFPSLSAPRSEHAIESLARMRTPMAMLELFAASRHWATRGEKAEAALAGVARRAQLDVLTMLARAGSQRAGIEGEAAVRFRELDAMVLERLMVSGWSAPLSTVIDWFGGTRSKGLVWRTDSVVFALDGDRLVDHAGRPVELRPDVAVSLVHVAEPIPDASAWRTWQAGHAVPFEQLQRHVPASRELEKLVDWNLDIDALRARTYRNGGLKDALFEEQRFVKVHLYRNVSYTIGVQPTLEPRLVLIPSQLPPVVAFELARDLTAARRA